jgi:hypothetical protein
VWISGHFDKLYIFHLQGSYLWDGSKKAVINIWHLELIEPTFLSTHFLGYIVAFYLIPPTYSARPMTCWPPTPLAVPAMFAEMLEHLHWHGLSPESRCHELLSLKPMNIPTGFIWIIIFLNGAFEYGNISKIWGYVGTDEVICVEFCNFVQCHIFVNYLSCYCFIKGVLNIRDINTATEKYSRYIGL